MYIITLSDGTELKNLELNGNNFISTDLIEDTIFENNLETVTISNGESTVIYEDMTLIANRVFDDKSWFILAEKTPQQKKEETLLKRISGIEQLRADIDFIAIMSGVDLL